MRTYVGPTAPDSDRLAADRARVRWGTAAAVTGMLAWLVGVALIPLDAKLEKGEQHLVQMLRAHTGQLYVAVLWFASAVARTRLPHLGQLPRGNPGPGATGIHEGLH
jgi:hypothetical protein